MIKVSVIFGTRPEVIKLASIIREFGHFSKSVQISVCFTGQHKEMVLPLLSFFDIQVDYHLNIMQPNQTLAGLSASSLNALDSYFENVKPDIVFVQGDTTTAMCAATAAFYRKIKVAHIEAGLRTYNVYSPFPEEFNRQVISKIADLNFSPTHSARKNLLKEGVLPEKIYVTGNTVIDALLFAQKKIEDNPVKYLIKYDWETPDNPVILITGHRRENFGQAFENICGAIKTLALEYPHYHFVYPVHLNPNVQEPVNRILGGINNVFLLQPMNYVAFTALMARCSFILSDSGGIQEEAPSFGKPLLILRDNTERMEAVEAGAAKLVGTSKEVIIENVKLLIENKELFNQMSNVSNPFGDGNAAPEIVLQTLAYFEKDASSNT